MTFYLSKFLWYLFNPFNCILFLLILVLILNFFKFLKFSKIILYFTFLLFFITGALPTGSYLLYLLENNQQLRNSITVKDLEPQGMNVHLLYFDFDEKS